MRIDTHTAQNLRRPAERFTFDNQKLQCHDLTTDQVSWSTPLPSQPKGMVAVGEDSVAFVTVGGGERLTCLDRNDGSVKWSRPFQGQTMMKSAYSDGDGKFVVYDSNNFGLRAFGAEDGCQKWVANVGDYMKGAPIGLAGQLAITRSTLSDLVQFDTQGKRV